MSVKFKCKSSGNVFSFELEHDIKTMRSHPEYEEVLQKVEDTEESPTIRKPGRPKKAEEPSSGEE